VLTGLALLQLPGQDLSLSVSVSNVFFRTLDPEEINGYVIKEEILSCAGAYKIQGLGACLVDRIEGSYSNVVGLPLETLYSGLKEIGIQLF